MVRGRQIIGRWEVFTELCAWAHKLQKYSTPNLFMPALPEIHARLLLSLAARIFFSAKSLDDARANFVPISPCPVQLGRLAASFAQSGIHQSPLQTHHFL